MARLRRGQTRSRPATGFWIQVQRSPVRVGAVDRHIVLRYARGVVSAPGGLIADARLEVATTHPTAAGGKSPSRVAVSGLEEVAAGGSAIRLTQVRERDAVNVVGVPTYGSWQAHQLASGWKVGTLNFNRTSLNVSPVTWYSKPSSSCNSEADGFRRETGSIGSQLSEWREEAAAQRGRRTRRSPTARPVAGGADDHVDLIVAGAHE